MFGKAKSKMALDGEFMPKDMTAMEKEMVKSLELTRLQKATKYLVIKLHYQMATLLLLGLVILQEIII